ncbi:MAG TPA: ABC transporter permease [Cellulomonas sp.]
MSFSRSLAVARGGARLLLSDPAPTIAMTAVPIVFIPFLIPGVRAQLRLAGATTATGAEHVVPGMLVLFAFLSVQTTVMLFYREHAWGTWDRLRASATTTGDLVVGKCLPSFAAQLLQCGVVLAVSAVAYRFRITGSVGALLVVLVAFVAALTAFGVALVAVFGSLDQAMVIGNLLGMVMAGLGGAFTPISSLPGWAQGIAHASPASWAIGALSRISLDGAGMGAVAGDTLRLLGFAAGCALVVGLCFRMDAAKVGTT